MEDFTHKSIITTPYQLTYSYYLSPSFNPQVSSKLSLPVLLLLHGFPDDAYMWHGAVPHLLSLGYPMILPDLLGFGGSSKPTEPARYNYRQQANSLTQILDHEGVSGKRVIPIGHDWGSATAQRFYLYHRERCCGLCILSLAYQVPSSDAFDLSTQNKETTKRFGYPQWAYWEFFTAPDAPELLRQNLDRFWEVNNGFRASDLPEENGRDVWMRDMFCTTGAMREYATGTGRYKDWRAPLKEYPHGQRLKQRFIERLSKDGLEGPVCYYLSLANNTMIDDERLLCEKDANGNDKRVIEVPMLYIGQTGDWVCRTDLMKDAKEQGLVPDLEEKVVDAGHWCLYEKPVVLAEAIGDWLEKRFPAKA